MNAASPQSIWTSNEPVEGKIVTVIVREVYPSRGAALVRNLHTHKDCLVSLNRAGFPLGYHEGEG